MTEHHLTWVHHPGGYGWTCTCGKGSPDAFHRTGLAALAAGRRHIRTAEDRRRER